MRDQSPGSTLLVLNLVPRRFSISCLPWLMVNLIALWSESCDIEGSIAQSLNVSRLMALSLVKDRSITEGRSPS